MSDSTIGFDVSRRITGPFVTFECVTSIAVPLPRGWRVGGLFVFGVALTTAEVDQKFGWPTGWTMATHARDEAMAYRIADADDQLMPVCSWTRSASGVARILYYPMRPSLIVDRVTAGPDTVSCSEARRR
jgi:hypothetical protein